MMRKVFQHAIGVACAASLVGAPQAALAQKARLTGLRDIAFGSISNLASDVSSTQDVCAYTQSATNQYLVTGTGSGSAGAFTLSAGGAQLAYDVQWASSAGQANGNQLAPNVPLTGLVSAANQQTCNAGPPASASLIIILRAAQIGSAMAGSYAGTLSLTIAPE